MGYLCNNNDREICKQAFLLIFDKCRKILKTNISNHLKENGPIPKSKRNKGKLGSCLVIWWYGKGWKTY